MSAPVAVALGSNLGDSIATLREAVRLCAEEIQVDAVTSAYESPPMYIESQPVFVNAVLVGRAERGPYAILAALKQIEARLGRQQRIRNGPRELDLDLLAYGALMLRSNDRLTLPHPRLQERRFVLEPWAEIAPDFWVPGWGTVATLAQNLAISDQNLRKIEDAPLLLPR